VFSGSGGIIVEENPPSDGSENDVVILEY